MADVQFGRIERLHIRNGEAAFDPLPTVVRTVKFAPSVRIPLKWGTDSSASGAASEASDAG
jgi:hypothetical protein